MYSQESAGDSEEESRKYGSIWTRRFSYDEMNKRLSTKRQPRRRLSSVELGRRLSNVGVLQPPVDIYDSDSDDVPEIDHSGPIHFTRRPTPLKHDGLPNYKDLLGTVDAGADGIGAATGKYLPEITKKSPRKAAGGTATGRFQPEITKKSPWKGKRYR